MLCHCGSSLYLPLQIGMTVLMVASFCGDSSLVRILLQAGADINITVQVRYSSGQILTWGALCLHRG